MGGGAGWRVALGGSLVAHALMLALRLPDVPATPRAAPPRSAVELVREGAPAHLPSVDPTTSSASTAVTLLGPPIPVVVGPGDFVVAVPSSPLPRADLDQASPRAAARGGGRAGGPASDSGRRDPDREEIRAQPWNDPSAYHLPRRPGDAEPSTPEPILRVPAPASGASLEPRRRRARLGDLAARPAQLTAPLPEAPPSADPGELGDQGAFGPSPGGAVRASPVAPTPPASLPDPGVLAGTPGGAGGPGGAPVAELGPLATETPVRGPAQDDTAARQASDERTPIPLEQNRPASGGLENGVKSPTHADGPSRIGQGAGMGASRHVLPRGPGRPSTVAPPQDPWVRAVVARVVDRVTYPPELALAFEQGLVVVIFRVDRAGRLGTVRLARSSGHRAFDDEVLGAVRRAAPFQPVPTALLAGRDAIDVRAPFEFENPLIR